jgi:hypothetical protein
MVSNDNGEPPWAQLIEVASAARVVERTATRFDGGIGTASSRLLWEQLKSISDATSFFNAVKAMDPIDLRKVVLAAKAEVIERER